MRRPSRRAIGASCAIVAAIAAGLVVGMVTGARRQQSASESALLRKGPYLQNVTRNSITVCWQTYASTPGKVRYRRPGGVVWQVASTSSRTLHQVRIVGLKPDTTYQYQVLSDTPLTSWRSFTTAKPRGRAFRFAVYGDNRMNAPVHARICRRILAARPDIVIHTGDLVDDGRVEEQWDSFFRTAGPLMRAVPMFVTIGNHEHDSKTFFDLFVLPGDEVYYSFDYGDAHFVSLQNSGADLDHRDAQLAWLEEDLAAHEDAPFTIVSMHRPCYTTGWSGMRPLERELIVPLLREYGVDLALSGHDHGYQRNVVDGITYVITAGAGAFRYGFWKRQPWVVTRRIAYNYCIADVTPSELHFRAYGLNGELLDEFTLQPQGRRAPRSAATADPAPRSRRRRG